MTEDPYIIREIGSKIERLEREIESLSSVWYLRPETLRKIEDLESEIEDLESEIVRLTPSQWSKAQ